MKRIILLTALTLLAGCTTHTNPVGGDPAATVSSSSATVTNSSVSPAAIPSSSSVAVVTPGRIALGAIPVSLRKAVAALADSLPVDTSTSVELGVLKTSKAFFFIIRNVGGSPIDSLVITTDNPAMTMTPGYIPVLNTDATTALQQIAELDVTHGSDIGNRSFEEPLLPYGRQVFHLRFSGVSAGQPFHAEFSVGLAAVYVSVGFAWEDPLPGDTLPQAVSKLKPTVSYGGTSCSVLFGGNPFVMGDSLTNYSPGTVASNVTSDCAIDRR